MLPDTLITHWGVYGEPNGTMTKFWGIALIPMSMLFLGAIMMLVPKMAKDKEKFVKIERPYYGLLSILSVFFMLIQAFIVATNIGIHINASVFFAVIIGLLFIVLGIIMKDVPQNTLIGVRTPWTLADEGVWNKTHGVAYRLFVLVGVIALLGATTEKYAMFFLFGSLLPALVVLFCYSYAISRSKKTP